MSFLFKGVNTTQAADKISAFMSTTCDFGTPLPICYGTCKRSPNLINYQDFYAKPVVTRVKTGKRSSSTTIDYSYYVYLELALCEGTIDGINRIWVGDKEFANLAAFNASADNTGAPLTLNTGFVNSPTAYMITHHPDIAVGYDNMAYLYGYVFLGTNSTSVPSYSMEVLGKLRSTGDGTDCNPASVIQDLLTMAGYGANIDSASFNDYLAYCEEAGIYISTPQDAFTSQTKTHEIIKQILAITNTYMFWSVDKFKFVPRDTMPRGIWVPHAYMGLELTPNEMAAQGDGGGCVIYERKDSSEIYNRFGVVFTNRSNNYENETVYYEDTTSILNEGLKSASDLDAKWIHTLDAAITVAEMQARINRTENIKYTIKLPWAYAYLEPGDIVKLTDPAIGLNQQLAMIDSVTEAPDQTLTVVLIKRDASTTVTYSTGTPDYNIIDNNLAPGDVNTPVMFIPPEQLSNSPNLELWIALQGLSPAWGGCYVYSSTVEGSYQLSGIHNVSSHYGKLITSMTSADTTVDIEFSNVDTVEMLVGSAADAAAGLTDIYIDGEYCDYETATLIGSNQYRLTGMTRGKYGSTAASHSINNDFVLLDGNLFSLQMPVSVSGNDLYLKFASFNTIGSRLQDINDIGYYTFNLSGVQGYVQEYVGSAVAGYLPLSGGTMTGDISGNKSWFSIFNVTSDFTGSTFLAGGNTLSNGAYFRANGKSSTNGGGHAVIVANNGTNSTEYRLYQSGIVKWNGAYLQSEVNSKDIRVASEDINSGSAGAFIDLIGRSSATNAGNFVIHANSSVGDKQLVGKPDGSFAWDGKNIAWDVKTGTTNGTISVNGSDVSVYTLPIASSNDLGGIKVGTNLSIDANGVLSATDTTYTITEGSANGTISVNGTDVSVHGLGSNAYSSTSYLPLSGGTMSGNITGGTQFRIFGDSSSNVVVGYASTNGAYVQLHGKSSTGGAGHFNIYAGDGTNSKLLNGRPSGTLTWDGQPIQVGSDKRLKQDFSSIPNDVLEVWGKVNWTQFKYKEDVGKKGAENCRWHVGLVAQDVVEVGEKNDVDLLKYGILCHDVQEATEEQDAVDLWTVRYTEALAMEVIYLRNEIKKLREEINGLR